MAVEIERKFLLANDDWRALVHRSDRICQGYMANVALASVRVRIKAEQAWLSAKSMTHQLARLEFEYPIPVSDASQMLEYLCEKPLLDKVRHHVTIGSHLWEIDEFLCDNAGLIVAEIELSAVDEVFARPAWLGIEVTHEQRYYNFRLGARPYSLWSTDEQQGLRGRS